MNKNKMSKDFHYYKKLSKYVKSQKGKVNFFDQNQQAFFLSPSSDEWLNMMKQYALTEQLTDKQVYEIESLKWNQMPLTLKIFAYDYCILNSHHYQQ